MGQAITLTPLEERHILALAHLELVCFSEPWSERSLREELTNPLARVWVAEQEGKTVGYAGMRCVVGEGYVNNVAVFPEYRRQGIGRALVEKLIAQAQRECAFLSLEVRASNEAALAVYYELGFEVQGIRRDFYIMPTEDAVIMTKDFRKGVEV